MWRVPAASSFSLLILPLVLGCGHARAGAQGEMEVIPSAPAFVLTIEDLAARVQRSRSDVGVRIEGVQVVAVLVRRARFCDLRVSQQCDMGLEGKYLFSEGGSDPDTPMMAVLLAHGGDLLHEGERYVLDGSVEMAPDVPQRWVFRGQVLAKVR